ncbi:MAG: DEAD/DEAH box helicase [Eggerthellaceae bacterium]|nr:DEAD/DEAH box helicase [Eggerthellaceae bacterium]
MASFKELGLSGRALAAVKRMGYDAPTPVQEQAIPLVLKGRDIVAAAQTGTGKTAAFALPSMDTLGHAKEDQGPLMLVVTPTRELAQQIGEVASQAAISTRHRITTVVGGLSYNPQIQRLKSGCDVLIATPGRLIDLMDQKAVRLSDVKVLVLDEADRMLDMGFLPSVKKIVAATPSSRQTLLFSATIDSSITKVVGSMLRNPATVEIARRGDVAETVDQYVIRCTQAVKPALIKAVLAEKGSFRVIVFARTRNRADSTCRRLRKAGYAVEAIHSDRSQAQRRRALDKFASGEVGIITATDVLARGIDVDQVDYVINYDVPEQAEDYIHRIGRTGRAGETGFAITFVTPETEGALRDIEKLVKRKIPEMTLESFDMEAAEAQAAEASITAQSKRDPEVNRVKRELANRAQKKAAKSEQPKRQSQARKKTQQSKRQEQAQKRDQQPKRREQAAKPVQQKQKAQAVKQGQPKRQAQSKRRSQQAKSDFRPGRAHRAEVQRSRQRKHRP